MSKTARRPSTPETVRGTPAGRFVVADPVVKPEHLTIRQIRDAVRKVVEARKPVAP